MLTALVLPSWLVSVVDVLLGSSPLFARLGMFDGSGGSPALETLTGEERSGTSPPTVSEPIGVEAGPLGGLKVLSAMTVNEVIVGFGPPEMLAESEAGSVCI